MIGAVLSDVGDALFIKEDGSILRRHDTQLKLLRLCALIALLLKKVMVGSSNAPNWSDALYSDLGLIAEVASIFAGLSGLPPSVMGLT